MKKGVFICLIVSLIVSCRKNENAYVKGQAIENDTGQPISGVIVTLTHGFKDENRAHHTETITTTTTDQNGFYQINYHRKVFNDYNIHWQSNNPNYLPIFDSRIVGHKKSAITIGLFPVSYIKIRLKKNTNSDSYVTISPTSPEAYNLPVIKTSSAFDTILKPICRVYAGHEQMIRWTLWPKDSFVVDRFILQRGDTLNYVITFN